MPSIVPSDETIYMVADDFEFGMVWPEAVVGQTDLETVITDIMNAQYNSPLRVIAFNTEERWSADVTADVAREIRSRYDRADEDAPSFLVDFIDMHAGPARQLSLRLVK